MKVHKALLLSTTVAAIAVNNDFARNDTNSIDASGSDKMKIKHLLAFPIFKFKLKLPFQNTSPSSLPNGQIGSVEENNKPPSTEWTFNPDGSQAPIQQEDVKPEDDCDGSDQEDAAQPSSVPSKGFGDMFMEMMNVGKDLTLEKIEVLKDVLFLIDRIKEETETDSTAGSANAESNSSEEVAEEDQQASSADNEANPIDSQAQADAKIDVWRSSIAQRRMGRLLKRNDISPEDLISLIKLSELKKLLKKNKSKGDENGEESDFDNDLDDYDQRDLAKRADADETIFEANDFSKLKEKLGMSGKLNGDGDSKSKLKGIFGKGGDEKNKTEQKEDSGSRKIKSHFKKDPPCESDVLITTITTVLTPGTDAPEEDCQEEQAKSNPYPYMHPKGEEYPEGLYGGPLSDKEECDGEEEEKSYNVPMNLREKPTFKSLTYKTEGSSEEFQIHKRSVVKRDDHSDSEALNNAGTPITEIFDDSDDSDNSDDEGNEKKKSRWSWGSIFGRGKNKEEEKSSSGEPEFESNWLLKKKFRLKKGKSKSTSSTTIRTVLNTSKPTEAETDGEEEDDPDCPKEKKERLRKEREEEQKRKEKLALKNDKESLKNEKKVLKEKLKKIPKSTTKQTSKQTSKKASYGKAKMLPSSKNGIIVEAPTLSQKPVPDGLAPVSLVTSEKRKNLLLLIPDEGDAKLLNPEDFASVASDFDQALVVNVAYKTVQTAYRLAQEKKANTIEEEEAGTDADEVEESPLQKHITKEKNSFEMVFKNKKAIEDTISKLFGGKGGANNDYSSTLDFDHNIVANDESKASPFVKFVGYDSFNAHQATDSSDVDGIIEEVFTSLKESGLIFDILTLSLKDKLVRSSLMDLTFENLKNGDIPWDEILMAVQAHGFNIDVEKLTFKKPEIGKILSKLVLDAIPVLIRKGALARLDVIKSLSFTEGPQGWYPNKEGDKSLEIGDDVERESSQIKLEKGHLEKHHYARNFNLTIDHTREHHEEKNKKLEKEDHVKSFPGKEFEKDGHEIVYKNAKKEHSEKLRDEEGIHKEDTKDEILHNHKEKYHEDNKNGESREERFGQDRFEQKKEKLEQDFQLSGSAVKNKRHEIEHYEENFHKNVAEKHLFDLLEQFDDGESKNSKEHHKEDNFGLTKNHHELNRHEEDHQDTDHVKDSHELDQSVEEVEHHKDFLRELNHRKRHEITHSEEDNHKKVVEHHEFDFIERSNDGSNKHEKEIHNEDDLGLVKECHELNHNEQHHGDSDFSKDVHHLDEHITEKEHHKNYEKSLDHEVAALRLIRRDELNRQDKLVLDKSLKSSTSFANEHDKDHYESNRTLGGQRHSKEHYAKEHHEKERHETAPGVEQYEKEKHDKEEHAKENHELGPHEYEQVVKEHGKVGDKLLKSNVADVHSESGLNVKGSGQQSLQVGPPIPAQVVLPRAG